MERKVLITDYAWDNLDEERDILGAAGATLVVAITGSEAELTQLASNVDGILTCWKPVTEQILHRASRCISIGRFGIGLDNIDVQYATTVGIVVTNVPSYCVDEVSDHAMALLLSCARKVAFYDRAIKSGVYDLQAGTPLYRLKGKTLGITGFGKIGRVLCKKAEAFGLCVIAYDPFLKAGAVEELGAEQVSFQDLVKRSDYVSIHVPLSAETRHLFNSDVFRQMKPTAFVINTSRGDVIDSEALLAALQEGVIAGAALDVLPQEPPPACDSLVLHPHTVITPHAAFNSEESLVELRRTAAIQMADVLSGERPQFIVNPEVLEQPNLRAAFKTTGTESS